MWKTFFQNQIVPFDGGMGTLLQAMGLQGGERPEAWNLLHPERIKSVHEDYLQAGAQVIAANTFGATEAHLGNQAATCMEAGVRIAKEAVAAAGHGYAAIDMGSLGRLPEPYGDMPFEEAVRQFREAFAVGIKAGGDLILIETMTDLLEVKACTLAAKEAMEQTKTKLPLLVSLTFDERGRLLSGADIPGTAAMLDGLGVDGVGLNCGHEPKALVENAKALLASTTLPVFINPNASLPIVENGKTIYPTTPEEFGKDMLVFAQMGAAGLGGCCGTTPKHIAELNRALQGVKPVERHVSKRCIISGRSSSMELGLRPMIIGERLNPTGKKRMKQALREQDMDYLLREAIAQCDAGADILDVNVGLPEIDEPVMLKAAVQAVQTVCDQPLQLDTADPSALASAIRGYAGKPLINSVCGKQAVMDQVFPIAKKYGGALVALCLDDTGIPATVEGRLAIADRILAEAERYGIPSHELLFDALTMTVATDPNAANVTLETIRRLHERGLKTVLGVSNVSFGLPQRPLLTAAFIAMAIQAGLDAAIMNPGDANAKAMFDAAMAISGKDEGFQRYLHGYGENATVLTLKAQGGAAKGEATSAKPAGAVQDEAQQQPSDSLFRAIVTGLGNDSAQAAAKRLEEGTAPLELIEASMMPALAEVGARYEQGKLFLPQLLQSANAAQAAFEVIRSRMPAEQEPDPQKRIVLATVKGDVHDIGKNIVKVLLQNYGFTVIDLGRDVAPEAVLEAAKQHSAMMVGLSALMTTTVPAMADTIALLHQRLPKVKVVVGGAVLTADYAAQIHADGYGRDAMATVRLCQEWSGGQENGASLGNE